MIGYILGLGDRHPQNIMLKQATAKVVHIDFGDCFEVTMRREKFPEKVPFRLTRMLTNALEVSRIEGTFRSCCENVMNLMRCNQSEILGIMEVFTYDPLLHWMGAEAGNVAESVIKRIKDKLQGCEFEGKAEVAVGEQVDILIQAATSTANLAVMFPGWIPWW